MQARPLFYSPSCPLRAAVTTDIHRRCCQTVVKPQNCCQPQGIEKGGLLRRDEPWFSGPDTVRYLSRNLSEAVGLDRITNAQQGHERTCQGDAHANLHGASIGVDRGRAQLGQGLIRAQVTLSEAALADDRVELPIGRCGWRLAGKPSSKRVRIIVRDPMRARSQQPSTSNPRGASS